MKKRKNTEKKPFDEIYELIKQRQLPEERVVEVLGLKIEELIGMQEEKKYIDEELAKKLEVLFGVRCEFWINYQQNYNERKKASE